MKKQLLTLILIGTALSVAKANFNCTLLHPDCVNFTYTKNFFENIEDRVESLNRFIEDYLKPTKQILKQVKFVIVNEGDEKHIRLQAEEDINVGEALFNFGKTDTINNYYFSLSLLDGNLSLKSPTQSWRFFQYQWDNFINLSESPQSRMIWQFLLHNGRLYESKWVNYTRALRTDVTAPIIQFDEQEIAFISSIDKKRYDLIRDRRKNFWDDFYVFNKNFYMMSDRYKAQYFLNYTEDDALKFSDYVWAKYLLETRTLKFQENYYFIPGLEYLQIDWDSDYVEDDTLEHDHINPYNAFYHVKRKAKKGDILKRPKIHDLELQFIYEGVIDRKREKVWIPLWAPITETFKSSEWHARLFYYLPFGDFGMNFKNDEESHLLLELLSRILNMNSAGAYDCYNRASTVPKDLGKLYLYRKLHTECEKPIITNDVGEYAFPEIKYNKNKLIDALYRINKEIRKLQIKKNEKCSKHVSMIKELGEMRLAIYEAAEKIIQAIPAINRKESDQPKKSEDSGMKTEL